jgi:Rieske Fe-S protein
MKEKNREDFLKLLNKSNPKSRRTSIQSIHGRVEDDDVPYVSETLNFVAPDMTTREVVLYESHLCSCNRVLAKSNVLLGRCQHPGCTNYVCAGCMKECRCGRIVCPSHASKFKENGEAVYFCRKCRILKWVRVFFNV